MTTLAYKDKQISGLQMVAVAWLPSSLRLLFSESATTVKI